jgi:hypothetical protein
MRRFSDRAGSTERLALTPPAVWPSASWDDVGTPKLLFRGSMAGLHVPLSTLRCALTGRQRMTQGHRGSLLLRCRAFSSLSSCRFIPALSPRFV